MSSRSNRSGASRSKRRPRYQAQGFERFWNSTFGVPQQILFRTLRALQDPNVDILSEEGLLDMSLIPGIGILDDDRNDVSDSEMVARVGLDEKKAGWKTKLAVSAFADPLILLTGGASALGRMGTKTTKALRTDSLRKVMKGVGVDVNELLVGEGARVSQKELLGHIDTALMNVTGVKKGKQIKHLQKARKAIRGAEDTSMSMNRVIAKGGEQELRIGLPVFHGMGAKIAVTTESKYWLGYLNSSIAKTKVGKAIGTFAGNQVGSLPYIKGALERMGSFGQGLKHSRYGTEKTLTYDAGERGFDQIMTRLTAPARTLYKAVSGSSKEDVANKFSALVSGSAKKGPMDPREAALKALGVNPSRIAAKEGETATEAFNATYDRFMRTFLHLADDAEIPEMTADILGGGLGKFNKAYKTAQDTFNNNFSKLVATPAGKAEKKAAGKGKDVFSWWSAGRKTGQAWGAMWRQGGKIADLDGPNKLQTRMAAQTSSEMREVGMELAGLLNEDAKGLGVAADFLDNMFLNLEQGRPMMQEITGIVSGLNRGVSPDEVKAVATTLDNFVTRLHKVLESTSVTARAGKQDDGFQPTMDFISNMFAEEGYISRLDFLHTYADEAFTDAVSSRASLKGPSVNRMAIPKGRHKGKFAGHLSDDELTETMADLVGKDGTLEGKGAKYFDAYMEAYGGSQVRTGGTIKQMVDMVTSKGFAQKAMSKGKLTSAKLMKAGDSYLADGDIDHALSLMGLPHQTASAIHADSTLSAYSKRITASAGGDERYDLAVLEATEVLEYLREMELPQNFKAAGLEGTSRRQFQKLDGMRRKRLSGELVQEEFVADAPQLRQPARANPDTAGVTKKGATPQHLNALGYAIGKLSAAASEIGKAGHLGLSPSVIGQVEDSLVTIASTMEEGMRLALGENTRFLDRVTELRGRSFDAAAQQGAWHIGAPLAYVGHIFSRSSMDLLEKTRSGRGADDAIKAALPNLGGSMHRKVDSMTIEEVNGLYFALKKGPAPESAAVRAMLTNLETIAGNEGLELTEKYTESMFLATMSRQIQALQGQANISYVDEALGVLEKSKTAVSGVIRNVVYTSVDEVKGVKKSGQSKVGKYVTEQTEVATDIKQTVSGVVIENADGKKFTMPMSFFTQDNYTGVLLDDIGVDVSTAMGMRATRGPLSQADLISTRLQDVDITELIGQKVVVGEKAAVNGVFESMQAMWKGSSELMVQVDNAQYMIKRFQTVYRPAFTVSNLASMFGQMSIIGMKTRHQVAGLADAIRYMGGDASVAKAYSKWNTFHAAGGDEAIGGLRNVVGSKNAGLSFLDQIKLNGMDEFIDMSAEEIVKKYPHLKPEDLEFAIGGQVFSHREILDAWRETNLMGTFVSEGLRNGGSTSRTTMQIKAQALRESGMLGKVGKGVAAPFKAMERVAEGAEVLVRQAMFFGGLRSGKSLIGAAEDAAIAAVDYANLTKFERTTMKRWFTYYTFPRHFVPAAGRHFAQNIDKMSVAAHTINSGPWREERGRLRYDFQIGDGDYSIDATRILPQLEALKVGETLGEIFLDSGAMFSDGIEQLQNVERLRGETPMPLTAGSLQSAAYAMVDGDERTSAKDILKDAFWISRFAFDAEDPAKEDSTLTKLRRVAFPVSDRQRDQEAAMIKRRMRKLQGQMTTAILNTNDEGEKAAFQEQLEYLHGVAGQALSDTYDQ
jgi:hypothetical protein